MSVALANYAASGLGERTACVELGGRGEFRYWKKAGNEGYFVDQGICFYPDFPKEKIPILMNRGYESIILDFGESYLDCREEILRCHRKVFLLNLNPWQKEAARRLLAAVQGEEWGNIVPYYAGLHMDSKLRTALEREFHINIEELPVIRQPLRVEAELFSCMDRILARSISGPFKKKLLIPIRRKR